MSDPDGQDKERPDRSRPSDDAALSRRLDELGRRLDESRATRAAPADQTPTRRPGYATALRVGADFVAGVVVGAALGWGFDRLFGTSPWGLIVFLMLGFAAGLLSVMRSAGLVAPRPGLDDDPAARR